MIRTRLFVVALLSFVGIFAAPVSTASAATCADYSNQADAQRAADTRDADGDGIYCESLPCPCLKPGQDGSGGGGTEKKKKKKKKKPRTYRYTGYISQVVDGDTLKVHLDSGKTVTVTAIGIDTPETKKPNVAVECGGTQATSNAMSWSFADATDTDGDGLFDQGTDGRSVVLKTDPTQSKTDRYGRLLAYVYRSQTASFARAQLQAGWANVYVYKSKPFKKLETFKQDRDDAKADNKGVWGLCGGDFHSEQ